MNQKKTNGNASGNLFFNLMDMNEEEVKRMFMDVSVKSLGMWLKYYQGKGQYEICKLIKAISVFKNGTSHAPSANR